MEDRNYTVWCIEAPEGNLLKEVTTHGSGQRILFTDRWDDGALKFGMKNQAEKFIKQFGLEWLSITDHMIVY